VLRRSRFSQARISVLHRLRLRAATFVDQHVLGRYLCLWQCRDDTWKITYLHLVVDAAKDTIVDSEKGSAAIEQSPAARQWHCAPSARRAARTRRL
jgi:hypothetical protein